MKSRVSITLVGFALCAGLMAQSEPVSLPELLVNSDRIANQAPAGTFAMPVSALRYEPRVDIQGRNLAEGQADVTLRGGVFENTGFRLGAVSHSDPQTGHYYAEIAVPPAMLGAPQILTGADHAMATGNSTVGAVAYDWRGIGNRGALQLAGGKDGFNRAELYQGGALRNLSGLGRGQVLGADIGWARSESDGSVPFGDHHFERIGARVQLVSGTSQTDLFAGYQEKFFGWRNLYTPFNSPESEHLQTSLFALNHRTTFGAGEFFEFGAFHRRNKDDYAFNRLAPLGAIHPFQHTTWLDGAALAGRNDFGDFFLNARAEISADDLKSTSLTFGRYHSRSLAKLAVLPEKSWALSDGAVLVAKAGVTYDDSNHTGSRVSPVFSIAREQRAGAVSSIYLSYAESTQLPSYTALNSNPAAGLFRGNPNLGRETSRNLEIGAHASRAAWSLQTAFFARRDDSLVDWTFQRGVTARSANPVDIDTVGIEFVARRTWSSLDLTLGYTTLTKDANYRGAVVNASFYALNYAKQRVTAAITWHVLAGFDVRMDNAARVQADNPLRAIGGDEALTSSLGLFYRPSDMRGLEFSLQADNLWNSNYQEVPAVPAARRQVALGVSYVW